MVFQNYALFPNMTVADNIGFGLKVRKRPGAQIKKRVGELLELINLPDKGNRFPYQLSGGQQQRIALARALAFEPTVLLLDEPLSALDAKIRVALRLEIRTIQRQLGITTVYVTHDQEEALSLSDRVVVMSEGRIEQVGTPFEIYNFPSTPFVASFVGTLSLVPGSVVDSGAGALTIGGQPIRIAKHFGGAAGHSVTLALRPEMVSLGAGADGMNRVTGRVTDVSFLGSIVRIRVALGGDGTVIALDEFNEPTLQLPTVDSTITINFPAEGPLVLDAAAPVNSVEALIAEK
jgi:putative spermidine/putrescine transport system ATP-binding protein